MTAVLVAKGSRTLLQRCAGSRQAQCEWVWHSLIAACDDLNAAEARCSFRTMTAPLLAKGRLFESFRCHGIFRVIKANIIGFTNNVIGLWSIGLADWLQPALSTERGTGEEKTLLKSF